MIDTYQIFADYSTIYVGDLVSFGKSIEDHFEDDINLLLRLDPLGDDLARFYTASNRVVAVQIQTLLVAPELMSTDSDLVSEVSLNCSSGQMAIGGGTDSVDDAKSIVLPGTSIRLRVSFRNMMCADFSDSYMIEMWPAEYEQPKLLYRNSNYPVLDG